MLTTTERVTVEQPVDGSTTNVETFKTRVIGEAPGGTTFDQTIDAAADSSAAADLAAAATASLTADGLRVTSTASSSPQRSLVDHVESRVVTPDRVEVTETTEVTYGPDTVQAGPDRAETVVLPDGATAFNEVTTTTTYVNVATNTTNTYLTSVTITITAVAPVASTASTTPASTTSFQPQPAASGPSDGSSGELARTGSATGAWIAAGITLLTAGAGCLHLSRRTARRRQPTA